MLKLILDGVFRSNPAYELVIFDRLSSDRQELLRDLTKDPGFYGVLMPRAACEGALKSVCCNTALLIHTLQQPSPLPRYLQHTLGGQCNHSIAQLVLDGVLEIEHGGRFVSGSEACSLIFADHSAPEPRGLLPRLSQAALEYAQALEIGDASRLSGRLYFYNRIPLTAHWTRRFPSDDTVLEFLGISDPANRRRLRKSWRQVQSSLPYSGWFQWQSRRAQSATRDHRPRDRSNGYKLYVSPQPDAMPTAFREVLAALEDSTAHHFKIGCDANGLLRPDKFVIYFHEFEPLERTARDISIRLSGCRAHGVPFTAPIGEDGLLSWGIDPPREPGALSWQETESWRLWVTNRLAAALVAARNNVTANLQPWQFALERLRLENVDTNTWTPAPDAFQPA